MAINHDIPLSAQAAALLKGTLYRIDRVERDIHWFPGPQPDSGPGGAVAVVHQGQGLVKLR
jgi:hypothetical protein